MKNLQERLQAVEQTDKSVLDQKGIQGNRIEQLAGELTRATEEKEQILSAYQRKLEVWSNETPLSSFEPLLDSQR